MELMIILIYKVQPFLKIYLRVATRLCLSFKANSLTSFGCDGSESNYVSLVRDESNFNLLIKDNKLCAEILTTDGLYLQETSDINLDENEWYNIACVYGMVKTSSFT